MRMKVSDFLNDESKWCQNYGALNIDSYGTAPTSSAAVRWCIMGAAAVCEYTREEFVDLKTKTDKTTGGEIVLWQDAPERKFAEVRRLLQEAGH